MNAEPIYKLECAVCGMPFIAPEDDEELCPLCDADEQFLSSCHGASS